MAIFLQHQFFGRKWINEDHLKMKGKQELAKIEIKLSLLFNAKISGLLHNLSCSSLFLQEKIGHNMFIVSRYARRCNSICIRLSEKKEQSVKKIFKKICKIQYFICVFFNTLAKALTTSKCPKLEATQRAVAWSSSLGTMGSALYLSRILTTSRWLKRPKKSQVEIIRSLSRKVASGSEEDRQFWPVHWCLKDGC